MEAAKILTFLKIFCTPTGTNVPVVIGGGVRVQQIKELHFSLT